MISEYSLRTPIRGAFLAKDSVGFFLHLGWAEGHEDALAEVLEGVPAIGVALDLLDGAVPALGNAVGLVVLEAVLEVSAIVAYGIDGRCNVGNYGGNILPDPVTKVEALEGVLLYSKDGEEILEHFMSLFQVGREREGTVKPILVPLGVPGPVLLVVSFGGAQKPGAVFQEGIVLSFASFLKLVLNPDAHGIHGVRNSAHHMERIDADRGAGKALPGQRDVTAMHVTAHELHLLPLA